MPEDHFEAHFRGRRVLVTGGLGFIGSSLTIRLAELGAAVTVADAMMPEYGGNLFNIEPVRDQVRVNFCDVCDRHATTYLVRDQDYIFHLAGQVSHILSLSNPFPDIEINIKGTAVLMEACRRRNPTVRVVYTGTRGQYGPAVSLPVNEDAPTNPKGIYEISNLTAEKIIKVYNDVHGVSSVLLRLTNVYGPRAQMKHAQYGVVNWFIRLAIDGQTIPVFGDGSILRDLLFVDDCVEALLSSAVCEAAAGEIFNVGVGRPTSILQLAETIVGAARSGRLEFAPFTPERAAQEPGDFYCDISKIREIVGWEPTVSLEEGVRRTIAYYRLNKQCYW